MPRGGKRKPGPGKKIGRPVLIGKRIKTSITLRPDHKEWLEGKNISGEIEIALDGHIEKENVMETIRVIVASTENCGKESVLFTDDWNSQASDLMPFGQTIDSDKSARFEIPDGFPLNYVLTRG